MKVSLCPAGSLHQALFPLYGLYFLKVLDKTMQVTDTPSAWTFHRPRSTAAAVICGMLKEFISGRTATAVICGMLKEFISGRTAAAVICGMLIEFISGRLT